MTFALTVTNKNYTITDKNRENESSFRNSAAYYQNLLDGGNISQRSKPKNCQNTRRKSIRFKPNGIVAFSTIERPIVTNIHDLAVGGVSFFHHNERVITKNEFKMDILIFDNQTDFEYFIGQIKGRIISREMISDPLRSAQNWRFSVKFLNLDSLQQSMLQTFCRLV